MYSKLFTIVCIAICLSHTISLVSCRKRSRTTTSTTPASDLELTLADREAALLAREEAFREREMTFKTREETLSAREEQFRERENKLSSREKNIAAREQNTLKGSCSDKLNVDTPAVDYSVMRWDEDSGKYHEIGTVSPCSEHMRFFASEKNETAGQCDCDYHQCERPLLYSDKYKQCFYAWTQGPCEQHEWYVFDSNYLPVCELNPCPESVAAGISSYYFKSPEDGKCYKAGSKGPCKGKGERLYNIPEDPVPRCRKNALCPGQSVPAVQRCFPGNRNFVQGQCGEEEEVNE